MTGIICPYLGIYDDAETALAYPSPSNRCYRPPKPASVSNPHQDQYCLSGAYTRCPIFHKFAGISPTPAAGDERTPQPPASVPVVPAVEAPVKPAVPPEVISPAAEMALTSSDQSPAAPLSAVESSEFGSSPAWDKASDPIPSPDSHITETQPMRPGAWLPDRVQPIQEIPPMVQKPPRRWLPAVLVGFALLVLLAAVLWWVFTALPLNWNVLGASSTGLLTPTPTTTRPALIILPSGFTPTPPAAQPATLQPTTLPSDSSSVNSTAPAIICFPPSNYVPYIVQAGDTLEALSKAVGVSVAKLRDHNCLSEASVLNPGDVIYLPTIPDRPTEPASNLPNDVSPTPAAQNP